jgi:hypothetical protein
MLFGVVYYLARWFTTKMFYSYSFCAVAALDVKFCCKRSSACDGDVEWACAALILTHLNDE